MALTLHPFISYLLGLLAMIKCSICSYQCDNWYVSNWRLACHISVCWGSVFLSLLGGLHVLRWHGTEPVVAHPVGSLWYGSYHQTSIHFISHTTNPNALASTPRPSQRSFHSIPIFRLWLKIGRAQCETHNFGAALCSKCNTYTHFYAARLGLSHIQHAARMLKVHFVEVCTACLPEPNTLHRSNAALP